MEHDFNGIYLTKPRWTIVGLKTFERYRCSVL